MATSSNRVPASGFAVWSPTSGSRDVERGRLPDASGSLALRDVYDRERPRALRRLLQQPAQGPESRRVAPTRPIVEEQL